jgi:hypothetical protein
MKKEKILLCGREFTQKELDEVVETVKIFKNLSRKELALTICDHLEWYTPAGEYKEMSANCLLLKLEAQGKYKLPAKRSQRKNTPRKIEITSRTDPEEKLSGWVSDYYPIEVEPIKGREERNLWNEYVERYHLLKYKIPFGARQRYFIYGNVNGNRKILGCFLFSAAAWALEERDGWIGWKKKHRSLYLNGIVNNTRFLIFPWVNIRNLASKSLSLVVKRICSDWKERYNYEPVLLETFVDEEKYTGACYKAANWIYLGKTQGRGRQDRYKQYLSSIKLIYMYPLVEDFRSYLKGEHPEWDMINK